MIASPKALQQLYRISTDAYFPIFIRLFFTLNGISDSERMVNNTEDIFYSGETFKASSFVFTPPSVENKKISNGSLTISCIDQRVIEIIRGVSGVITCEVVAGFYYDNNGSLIIEPIEEFSFELAEVNWNGISATWEMQFDNRMSIQTPCDKMSAQRCPGIA